MPVIGKTMSKGVSPVPFVCFGFIFFSAYCWTSAAVSPGLVRRDFFFSLALRALGLSLVQLPLINQAVAGLEPKDYASGISLNNMIRQLGGAFGIALANNYVAQHYAQHKSDIVSNLADGSAQLTARVNTIAHGFMAAGSDSASAVTKAYTIINASADKQAYYLSYLDTFRLIGLFFLFVIPLVVFLRVKKKTKQDEAAIKAAIAEAH